ncbi:MAG: Sir2 family NAD-dependent protein deacetylase [Rikenellaceae bacterium]
MKRVVVFTGAGVSRDSGIATFRDSDGLWANHRIEDVCTPEALVNNRAGVVDFYNTRRKELLSKEPNAGHIAIADLENHFDVEVVTQNIDDLHERGGSTRVTHLHGELRKLRSSRNESVIFSLDGWEQPLDMKAPDGALARPFVVFFGEGVPMIERAAKIVETADVLVIVGTSLAVYPAASLVRYVSQRVPIYLVDPNPPTLVGIPNKVHYIGENSITGVPKLCEILKEKYILGCN